MITKYCQKKQNHRDISSTPHGASWNSKNGFVTSHQTLEFSVRVEWGIKRKKNLSRSSIMSSYIQFVFVTCRDSNAESTDRKTKAARLSRIAIFISSQHNPLNCWENVLYIRLVPITTHFAIINFWSIEHKWIHYLDWIWNYHFPKSSIKSVCRKGIK